MSHVFFRSIFRVLPLFLVLSPVNSSSCSVRNKTEEIRAKYENVLIHDISELVNMSAEYRDRCCRNKKHDNPKVFFCNDTQEIESLQSMACNMLKFFNKQKINKDFRWKATSVSCGTLNILECRCERHKKEKSLQSHFFGMSLSSTAMTTTARGKYSSTTSWFTINMLNSKLLSNFETSSIGNMDVAYVICILLNRHNKEDTGSAEHSKKKCNQEFCELKENISSLRSCWNKFGKIISR